MNFSEEKMKKNSIAWFVVECTKSVTIQLRCFECRFIFPDAPRQLAKSFHSCERGMYSLVFALKDIDCKKEYFLNNIIEVDVSSRGFGKADVEVKTTIPNDEEYKRLRKLIDSWYKQKIDTFSFFLGIVMYSSYRDWRRMKELGVKFLELWQDGFSKIGWKPEDVSDYEYYFGKDGRSAPLKFLGTHTYWD